MNKDANIDKITKAIETEIEAFEEVMDVSRFRNLQKQLERFLIRDPVTITTLNRWKIQEVIETEINKAVKSKSMLYLLMIDIDSFKRINDYYGHNTGDEVLRKIAAELEWVFEKSVGKTYLLGRWGGDEFIYVLPSTTLDVIRTNAQQAIEQINRIYCKINSTNPIELNVSMGLAVFMRASEGVQKFVERADKAMYKAKQKGGNRLEVVPPLLLK